MMGQLESRDITCPYCWETITLTIDCSISKQKYIEDCQVCCRPFTVSVEIPEVGVIFVRAAHEDE